MSVSIQDVLALLPELFPGVQSFPYANIRPNPNNPGPALTDQEIQELADNLAERGLVNPIKVQPDPTAPLAGGVKIHPENPRLAVSSTEPLMTAGRPWKLGDFNFRILAGERRYRAAGRLKWESVPGFILNPTEEEAVEITHLDNDVRDRGWWAGYQSIEQLVKANPGLTQRQVAAKLKMDAARVNRALGLLPLLNPEARGLIVANCNNSNKGIWGISESAVLRLGDLGPGSPLKQGASALRSQTEGHGLSVPIPEKQGTGASALRSQTEGRDLSVPIPQNQGMGETLDLIRQTLEVAIDEQMTEAGVKGLVRWVQDGGQPDKFKAKGSKASVPPKDHGKDLKAEGELAEEASTQEAEDEDSVKPIPWSENVKHPEYLKIPTARIRVNSFLAQCYAHSLNVERKALSMRAVGYADLIKVRRLSESEKQADPLHDYELFDEIGTLKGAEMLGWSTLDAQVYAIDEWEGVRLHHHLRRHTTPLTWIEVYSRLESLLAEGSKTTLEELAIIVQEDPALLKSVLPAMKLLNESAQKAIWQSIRKCYEDGVDMGNHRFYPQYAIPLTRLEGLSKNPLETQKLVEQVVGIVIENEMYSEEVEELVDWVLAGNDPEAYFEKEA